MTCDYQALYDQYSLLVREHPGWSLTDLRSLTVRERQYWCADAAAMINRRLSG